jgi:type IV pilus assembly protein PilY1
VDGWRMDLEGSGERNLSTPKILGGAVFFTSFTPPGLDICSFGGESRIYGLYFLTGTAHPKGILGEDQETHESFKSMSIGTGMPASTGLHVAGEKSGATGFIQHSTGSITQLDLTPPLKFRSGTTAWIQR